MGKSFSDDNKTVKHSIKIISNIFRITTIVSNFKHLYNSIHELLNVFDSPAKRMHTILLWKSHMKKVGYHLQSNKTDTFIPCLI